MAGKKYFFMNVSTGNENNMAETTDTLTCRICGNEATLASMVRERALDGGTLEIGLSCVACDHWTHSYYTNRQLKQEQGLVQYKVVQYQNKKISEAAMKQARDKFKANFARYQQECARALEQ